MARIDALLDELLAKKGSDLHIGVGHAPLLRRRGELEPLRGEALGRDEVDALLLEVLSPADRERIRVELDVDFSYAYDDKARFRASYYTKATGLAAVFRAMPPRVTTLDELGGPDVLRRIAERRTGLTLVAGPSGSGKTTTLAAIVDHINRSRACHVVTIEQPVEIEHEGIRAHVTHRELGRDAGSFAVAVRAASREDADVVLVGELGDAATMKQALSLAGFGTLVLGAVRTTSAAATIEHIINAFPAEEQPQVRGMLAENLVAVVAQQLLPMAEGKGKALACEILLGSSALSAMIRDGKTSEITGLMQAGSAVGMQTMDAALERLVARGVVSPDDALERAADKEAFQRLVARRTGTAPRD